LSFPDSQGSQFVFIVYPTDSVVPIAYECFFFIVTVRELQVQALADTAASDSFISAVLAKQLGVILYQRKKPLQIRIADGSVRWCLQFVCLQAHIGTWPANMVFTVLESGNSLVLGMPLFLRFEPQRW